MPTPPVKAVSEVLDAHEKLLIDQVVAKHRDRPGAMLGILEAVQSANPHKYLSMESLRYVAEQTGVPARAFTARHFLRAVQSRSARRHT